MSTSRRSLKWIFTGCGMLSLMISLAQAPVLHVVEKKSGEFRQFLDSAFQPVSEEQAVFFIWTLIDQDIRVWDAGVSWRKEKYVIERTGAEPGIPGQAVPFHGSVKWFTKGYRRLVAEEQFDHGYSSGQTIVYGQNGEKTRVYFFDKRWNNLPWSFYLETYRKEIVQKGTYAYFDRERHSWRTICTEGCTTLREFK